MTVNKALSIISVVEKVLPLNPSGIVKIEFGNSEYQTRQMYPADFIIDGDNLIVNLDPDFTQCKAIGRGGSCGTEDSSEECCAPSEKKAGLVNLASSSACCTPGGGCC